MEWKEVRLGDVCEIKHGFAYKGDFFSDTPTCDILVTPGNFTLSGGFKLDKPKYYNGPVEKDYVLSKDDLIVTMTDLSKNIDTLGYSALVPEVKGLTFHHNQRIGLVENIANNVDKYFLYWIMRTPAYQSFIATHSSGTTVHHTSPKGIGNYIFKLPPLAAQRRIASLLSSLDRKIELNNKINADLEEMAQTIFKNWFVDFEPFKDGKFVDSELGRIPEGWRVVSLDDLTSKFGTGLNPRKNFVLGHGDNYYLTIKNMGNNRIYLNNKCDKVDDEALVKINKRSKLQKGDLLFSGIGTIGRVAMVVDEPVNWNTSESVFNMHPIDTVSSEFIYLLLLSDKFQQYVQQNAQGGVQQGIRMASLKAFQLAIPDNLETFDNLVKPIIGKVKSNDKENDTLSALRDTLLPRLMSGEIEIIEH